jgi:hypothetical protein
MRWTTPTCLLACALALTGCGGGGADTGNNTAYAADAAFKAVMSRSFSRDLTGSYQNQATALGLQFSPGSATQFPLTGAPAREQRVVTHFSYAGQSSDGGGSYYFDSAGALLGSSTVVDNQLQCSQVTRRSPLPGAATVGQAGLIGSGTVHAGCDANAPQIGTFEENWSIRTRHGGIYLCLTTVSTIGTVSISAMQCYGMTVFGQLDATAWFETRAFINGEWVTLTLETP